jgi:hypothetical protein
MSMRYRFLSHRGLAAFGRVTPAPPVAVPPNARNGPPAFAREARTASPYVLALFESPAEPEAIERMLREG